MLPRESCDGSNLWKSPCFQHNRYDAHGGITGAVTDLLYITNCTHFTEFPGRQVWWRHVGPLSSCQGWPVRKGRFTRAQAMGSSALGQSDHWQRLGTRGPGSAGQAGEEAGAGGHRRAEHISSHLEEDCSFQERPNVGSSICRIPKRTRATRANRARQLFFTFVSTSSRLQRPPQECKMAFIRSARGRNPWRQRRADSWRKGCHAEQQDA